MKIKQIILNSTAQHSTAQHSTAQVKSAIIYGTITASAVSFELSA